VNTDDDVESVAVLVERATDNFESIARIGLEDGIGQLRHNEALTRVLDLERFTAEENNEVLVGGHQVVTGDVKAAKLAVDLDAEDL